MWSFAASPRVLSVARALCVLVALLALVGCADGQTNPLTDTGAQQSALDTVGSLRFWLWIVVAVAIAIFGASFVSQTWIPEWFQSHRMSIRVGALVVAACLFGFNWALGQAESSMGTGGIVLVPLQQLVHALPLLVR